ncbi:MAG TPA: hypothetical protein VN310_17850 [Candidatus Dormibacteraeota bacterium]|nr:hypothetical protein [Candidatus Dormibacteraeota bacterium]
MGSVVQNANRLIANTSSASGWRMVLLVSFMLMLGPAYLHSQCPDNGQTKVIKPDKGTGYYFYMFLGDSSFRYFLDGKTFSFNDKDDPGKTIIFIDNMAYESIVKDKDWDEIKKYIKGPKAEDILRAEAKQHQDYHKSVIPSMVITDFGISSDKNPDGSEGRAFYLWKKENPPGKEAATQYFCSTVVKNGVVVLSIMLIRPSVSEDDVFRQLREYTSHFDLLSSEKCKQVLSMPSAP